MKGLPSAVVLAIAAALVATGYVTSIIRAQTEAAGATPAVFETATPPPAASPEPLFPGLSNP